MQPKHLSLILFASMGINLFLGGMWVGTLFDSDKDHQHKGHEHRGPRAGEKDLHHKGPHAKLRPGAPLEREHGPFSDKDKDDDEHRQRHGGLREGRRGDGPGSRDGGQGPDDLVLLRHMVRIMGGPDDPRVKKLKETSREDIRATRQAIRDAHQKVHETLAAEPLDEKALRAALADLSEKSSLARTRAQTGIVELATLMTPEERKALREKSPPGDKGPNKNLAPHLPGAPKPSE